MTNEKFSNKLDEIKDLLTNLICEVSALKSLAATNEEKEFVEDMYCAIDNVVDISCNKI